MQFTNEFGKKCQITEVIFPLVIKIKDKIQFLGTGFFIHSGGGFLTARHNFFDNDGKSIHADIMAIDYRNKDECYFRKIDHFVAYKNQIDVCVGMLTGDISEPEKQLINEKLTINTKKPNIGDKVATCAYPLNEVEQIDQTNFLGKFRIELQQGEIVEHLPNGRDSSGLPYECYQTSIRVEGGASGGPVIDEHGYVIGINSRGLEAFGEPVSWITPITEIYNLRIPFLEDKSLAELKESGLFNFMEK